MLARFGSREGEGWFPARDIRLHEKMTGEAFLDFFAALPLALERTDLRLVHACWDDARVAALREAQGTSSALELYRAYERGADERSRILGRLEKVRALLEHYGSRLRDATAHVPMLEAVRRRAELSPERAKAVVCAGGLRSSAVISALKRHGLTNFHNVTGGMAAWVKAGYTVEKP